VDDASLMAQLRALIVERGLEETLVPAGSRLLDLAADGTIYRDDLIRVALEEGVRAHGPTFDRETYRGVLAASTITTIKRMSADWKTQGDARLKPGRLSRDVDTQSKPKPALPKRAFKTRAA
jgi:hypothetical protein